MKRIAVTSVLLFAVAMALGAQDLKPVKDKDTKLFGYQDKAKNWVIEPQFDNAKKFHGPVAEVMARNGRSKLWGVIDTAGDVIIPVECENININEKHSLIFADRYFELEDDGGRFDRSNLHAWGVYDIDGNEIFAPQFDVRPSFNGDGYAVATDKASGKDGIISIDGTVVLPFENYDVQSSVNGFNVLGPGLSLYTFSGRTDYAGKTRGSAAVAPFGPGSLVTPCTVPYRTDGDDVKAAAYGHRRIGERLTANTVFTLSGRISSKFVASLTNVKDASGVPVNWGRYHDRFIRLELVGSEGGEFCVPDPETGRNYTVCANLYEADGTLVECLRPEGVLSAELAQGVIYTSAGGEQWFIAGSINWPYDYRQTQMNLTREIPCDNVLDMVGLTPAEKNLLHDFWKSGTRHRDVELADIGPLLSYEMPAELGYECLRYQDRLYHEYPFLRRKYYAGQVLGVSWFSAGERESRVKTERLHANIVLDYTSGFNYHFRDEVYWGVNGDRYIRIVPVPRRSYGSPSSLDGMVDDRPDSPFTVSFLFCLYEDDGTFVQTLGSSHGLWFGGEDVFGFKDVEWVFTHREPYNDYVTFRTRPEFYKMTGTVRDLDSVEF